MECGSGQYNILSPPPFSACVVYTITFNGKQWLLQRLFTTLAVQRTSQSHLETVENFGLIPLATQLQESKRCLDGIFSSRSSCCILLAIDIGNQKEVREEHSKGSFHTPLEGWQKHLSQQGKDMTANFSVYHTLVFSYNEAEARISSSDLRRWHTSMAAD